jgi:hypothetical protein
MSYADYAAPGSGYAPYARPGYQPGGKAALAGAKSAKKAQWKFTELFITGGVGPFHTNHFVGYSGFEKVDPTRAALKAARLTTWLRENFCAVFSEKNIAAAAPYPERKFDGSPTVEFTIGGNLGSSLEKLAGEVHSDWVVMREDEPSTSFYGSTLKREWLTPVEDNVLTALDVKRMLRPKGKPTPAEDVVTERMIFVNQHHFLAGRRSWKVGYDAKLYRFYVETAAFERSSLCEYSVAEESGVLRESVVGLWTNLIDNVESHAKGWIPAQKRPEAVPPGYRVQGNAAYRAGQHKTAAAALDTEWFAPVLLRHPGLVKGLAL